MVCCSYRFIADVEVEAGETGRHISSVVRGKEKDRYNRATKGAKSDIIKMHAVSVARKSQRASVVMAPLQLAVLNHK